ncbi:MAG: glycosyltransferase [Candidatus Latescibacterota bacterium]|nr:MAG: glycosyltransferase [Candidatus Latescibacterota bacterium]
MASNAQQNERRRKLLLVAYDFPPVTSAGMLRVAGMTKYLLRKNWDVTVLTVKRSFVHTSEDSLELIPEGVRVVRTWSFELRRLERWLVQRIEGRSDAETLTEFPDERLGRFGWRSWCSRMVRRVFALIIRATAFPDPKAGWLLPLLFRSWRLMANERYDVVLSSSLPHSLQLAVLLLRKLRSFRWVTDFRDPWTIPERGTKRKWDRRIRRFVESKVLTRCDAVVTNTPGNYEALIEWLGDPIEKKALVITNGFDTEVACDWTTSNRDQPGCDFVYTGEVYPGMLDTYVRALRFMREQGTARLPKLWVFGRVPGESILRGISDSHLQGSIEFKGRIPFDESLRMIRDATALLLLLPHAKGFETCVPSKLYPYLFSPRPILALAPRGDATRIVEKTGRGVAVATEEPADVAEAIIDFLNAARTGALNLKRNDSELEKYRMEILVDRMDDVLRKRVG